MGDAVAAVVARTREQALVAAQAVDVQYSFLPEVTTTRRAMEPENSVAYMEGEGQDAVLVVVMGRSINIHIHMAALQTALGYDNIRYEEPFSGGQFGMKLEKFNLFIFLTPQRGAMNLLHCQDFIALPRFYCNSQAPFVFRTWPSFFKLLAG